MEARVRIDCNMLVCLKKIIKKGHQRTINFIVKTLSLKMDVRSKYKKNHLHLYFIVTQYL